MGNPKGSFPRCRSSLTMRSRRLVLPLIALVAAYICIRGYTSFRLLLLPFSAVLSTSCSANDGDGSCDFVSLVGNQRARPYKHIHSALTFDAKVLPSHGLRDTDKASDPSKPLAIVSLDNIERRETNGSDVLSVPENGSSAETSEFHSQRQPQQDENQFAMKEVISIVEHLRRSARYPAVAPTLHEKSQVNSDDCASKRIFIYNLPEKFNEDLLRNCRTLSPFQDMCEFLSNSGMGKLIDTSSSLRDAEIVYPSGVWHTTHQYALEVLFHERLKQYKCLSSPDVADLFYIPYYGGLDVMRWHFVENISNSQKDQLGQELVNWLREQPAWQRRRGLDHVLVLGKITWDFRRPPEDGASWGSSLLWKDEMANITKLLIEREPWQKNEVGIPHPTFFHPRSDMDVKAWQNHAASQKRRFLVSFAGQGRPNQPESIRSELIRQCLVSSKKKQINMNSSCHFLNCTGFRCDDPTITMKVFLESEFCMQPSGDSPTRRSVFDSLISGCIPVLFDPFSAYFQYPWHLPEDSKSYSVFFRAEDVKAGKIDLIKELRRIPAVTREEMRLRIIHDIMPGLVYARPDARLEEADDAFVISLKSLFARVSQRSS